MAMYNDILQSGSLSAMLRDVIITVLYKGKDPRDECDSYRGISLMSHKGIDSSQRWERLYQRTNLGLLRGAGHRIRY